MTLYFASYQNNARIGEAWLNFGGSWQIAGMGSFGLNIGLWAHGGTADDRDTVRLGDRFVWANFIDGRLRFIGGQGGGTPITSGGWLNADWLGYAGLRFFWVDPSGLSLGLILPDPGDEGVSPVNYLSMLGFGVGFRHEAFHASVQFDNSPIYDDRDANFYGGLRRPAEQDPIAMSGNIAVGVGMNAGERGSVTLEGMFTNLGEEAAAGMGRYTISPVSSTFAVTADFRATAAVNVGLRGSYTVRQGDAPDFDRAGQAVNWGRLEIEPHFSVRPADFLRFDFSLNWTHFVNSFYLALDATVAGSRFFAGQVPGYTPLLDYLSPFIATVRPRLILNLAGAEITLGYTGIFSRDQLNNAVFADFRWMF